MIEENLELKNLSLPKETLIIYEFYPIITYGMKP